VLDPAGLREVLRKLALRDGGLVALVIEDDRTRAARSLVDGEKVSHAFPFSDAPVRLAAG